MCDIVDILIWGVVIVLIFGAIGGGVYYWRRPYYGPERVGFDISGPPRRAFFDHCDDHFRDGRGHFEDHGHGGGGDGGGHGRH